MTITVTTVAMKNTALVCALVVACLVAPSLQGKGMRSGAKRASKVMAWSPEVDVQDTKPPGYDHFVDNYKQCYSPLKAPLPIQALLRVYAESTSVNTFHDCQITAHNVWTGYISAFYAANYNPGLFFMDPKNGGGSSDSCSPDVVAEFYRNHEKLLALSGLLHDTGKIANYDPILGPGQCMHSDNNMISRCPETTALGWRTVAGHPMDSFLMCMGNTNLYVTKWAREDSKYSKYFVSVGDESDNNSCLERFPTPEDIYKFDFDAFFKDLSISTEKRELVCLLTGMHYTFGDINKSSYGGTDSIDPQAYTLGAEKMKNGAAASVFRQSAELFVPSKLKNTLAPEVTWKNRSRGMKLRLKGFLEMTPTLKSEYDNKDGLAKLAMLSNVIGYADVAAAAQKEPNEAIAYYKNKGDGLPLGLGSCMWFRDESVEVDPEKSKLEGRFEMRSGNDSPADDYRSPTRDMAGEISTKAIFSEYDFSGLCTPA